MKAFITGINGQDGSYLADLLLQKGYYVYGLIRRKSENGESRIDHLIGDPHFQLLYGDVTDSLNIYNIIKDIHPNEVYNLAAQSFVGISWKEPIYTANVDAMGTLNILDAIQTIDPKGIKFYQASTSEMYGNVLQIPQTEITPFNPNSPYAVSKVFSFYMTKVYRESYNMFACNGILFNHESELRGEEFVTRKITLNVARIKNELNHNNLNFDPLALGNIYTKRDWGYAKDYVKAMWMMLQHKAPIDFVIASGEMHTVKEFINLAFNKADINIKWMNTKKGNLKQELPSLEEYAIDEQTGTTVVKISDQFFRPNDVPELVGNSDKAHLTLNWYPLTSFEELVELMVKHDLELYKDIEF